MPPFLTLLTLLCIQNPDESPDRSRLASVIESLGDDFRDCRFEYEGRTEFPSLKGKNSPRVDSDGLYDVFSGVLILKQPDRWLLDVYHQKHGRTSIHRETIASSDGRLEEYSREVDQKSGGGVVSKARYDLIDRPGSFGRVFLRPVLLGMLKDPTLSYHRESPEPIDGHVCEKVRFDLQDSKDANKIALRRYYWIDLGRSGHVLRRESKMGGTQLSISSNIEIAQVKGPDGRMVWFPVSAEWRSYVDVVNDQQVYRADPVYTESYRLLAETIQFDRAPSDQTFSIKFKPGVYVNDKLRSLQYAYSKAYEKVQTGLSRADAQKILETTLADADQQAQELRAASWERDGDGISAWLPWAVAGGAVFALAVVGFKGRSWRGDRS